MYLSKTILRAELIHWQGTGEITPSLTLMLCNLIRGVISRYYKGNDADDLSQDCFIHVLSKLHLIDTDSNAFAYLTQLVRNCVQQRYLKQKRYSILVQKYAAERVLPEV